MQLLQVFSFSEKYRTPSNPGDFQLQEVLSATFNSRIVMSSHSCVSVIIINLIIVITNNVIIVIIIITFVIIVIIIIII